MIAVHYYGVYCAMAWIAAFWLGQLAADVFNWLFTTRTRASHYCCCKLESPKIPSLDQWNHSTELWLTWPDFAARWKYFEFSLDRTKSFYSDLHHDCS